MSPAKARPSAESQAQNAALIGRLFLASYPAHTAPANDTARTIVSSPITLSRVEGGRKPGLLFRALFRPGLLARALKSPDKSVTFNQ